MKIIRKYSTSHEFLLLTLLLLGSILRIKDIGYENFWLDEIKTVWYVSSDYDLLTVLKRVATKIQGPLYYTIIHYWLQIFDTSETTIRIPSAIFGISSIYFLYRFSKQIFNKNVGIFASIILSVSYVHFYYSQEARTYTLTILLTILSFHYMVLFIEKNKKYHGFLYVLITTLLIYSHYYVVFTILAQNIFMLIYISRNKYSEIYTKWIKLQIPTFFLVLPAIIYFFRYQIKTQDIERGASVELLTIWNIFKFFSGSDALLIAFLSIAVFGTVYLLKSKHKTIENINSSLNLLNCTIMLFIWLLIPILLPLLISYFFNPIFYKQYFLTSSIPFYILIALGISKVNIHILRTAILIIIMTFSLLEIFNSYKIAEKPRWSEVAEVVDQKSNQNDTVVIYAGYYSHPFNYYSKGGFTTKKFHYDSQNRNFKIIKFWEHDGYLNSKDKEKILSNNSETIWYVTKKTDNKNTEIINFILQKYRLNSQIKFTTNSLIHHKNEGYLYHFNRD